MNKTINILTISLLLIPEVALSNYEVETKKVDDFSSSNSTSIALGLGAQYGGGGVKLAYRYDQFFEPFVSYGDWGGGIGTYFYPFETWSQFRISGIYGPNTSESYCSLGGERCVLKEKIYRGYLFALGLRSKDDTGWEFDIAYILTRGDYHQDQREMKGAGIRKEDYENPPWRFTLGYRWSF